MGQLQRILGTYHDSVVLSMILAKGEPENRLSRVWGSSRAIPMPGAGPEVSTTEWACVFAVL